MNIVKSLTVTFGIFLLASITFMYSGLYPMGADVPHSKPVYWALETLRERSIQRAAALIQPPELDDPQMLLSGGADYNDMCAGCHLKPGKTSSDLSTGLYPTPPNLTVNLTVNQQKTADSKLASARQFWIIKHGIKASGMPAWGASHDDARIWAMVAFIQKMPTLTPDQYQILTARESDDMAMNDTVFKPVGEYQGD